MASEHPEGDMSEISSLTDSSDEGKKVVEEVVEAVEEIDKPAYSDEDLETLVGFIRGMIILFDYEDEDFNEEVAETIKLWLTDANNPMLFIFYDGNRLSASLAFPLCPINDLMYFMREQDQLYNVIEQFHDDILFGTLHGDIEGSLLVQLEQVYGPMILSNLDWSENVKANVINGFNAFMTYLTELHYKLSGLTLLYIPREGSDMEVQEVVLNRSMIKRLEAVVIDWTGQIRATLSDTQHFVPDDLVCPADEYSFWLYRHEVLSAIRLQYKGPNVQHIVCILELAQSLYIKHLKDVLEDLDKEIEIAESNIPFLKLLVDPCFAIGTLETADDFCSQLIYVMHIIRFIGQDSQYLNKDESITKMFLYLSNEIVACCMRGIDVDRILAGAPRYGIEVCQMKINCCESYKIIYEEMLAYFKDEFKWNLDYAAIFNRINAFLQRLNDILEICDAMLVFGRYAESTAYTNYRFFCNNAEEFERRCEQVEKIFHNSLETIESVGSTILDINNKEWYQYIGEFREMLKSLDDIIENLLSNVFLMSENLEEKLNVLVTLLNFYNRENIRESFMRKIGEVWNMLRDEITQLSKDVSAGITEYPALLPPHAGRYAVLKMRFDHLTHLRTLVVNCRFFPEYPQQEEVLALYEACEKQVKTALKGFHESWCKSITTDMASWYQRNLISRSHLRPGLFEVNIERRLLDLFDEAFYFKSLGVAVPMSLDLEKHENTRLTFDNVLRLVLYFNGVISSISDKERLFFKPMIQQTERKLEPLRSKLTWEEDLSEFIEGYVVNVRELLDLIELYKRENLKISALVERIYGLIFVRLEQPHPINMSQLMNSVTQQKKSIFSELLQLLTEISQNIFNVYDSLGSNIRKMSTIWEQYLHKIDRLLKAAIFTCTLNTLRGVQGVIENAHSSPIMMIEILLKKDGAVYEPSADVVEETLRQLVREVCLTIRSVPSMARRYQLEGGERSFYLQLLEHSDYVNISNDIDGMINDTVAQLRTYQEKWNVFRPFWCVDKAAFIERFKLTAMTSEAFQKNIEKFEELQNQLSTQGDFAVCRCVEIDALKLKYAITTHIVEWQTNYIEYLKCIAYGKIIDFNNILKKNVAELLLEPTEVYELKRLEERYQTCFKELPEKELEIAVILKYFKVLEKYVADLLPEAYELRRNIDQIWAQYQIDLKAIKERIENYQDQFKLSMTGAADALKVDALQMLKMLHEEMPLSDDMNPNEAFETIDRLMVQLEQLERREREIQERMQLLGVPYAPLAALREIRSKLENLRHVWVLVQEWRIARDRIMPEIYRTSDEIELHMLSEHFQQAYDGLAEGPIGNEAFDVFVSVGEEISHFRVTVTIVCAMRNSFMQDRHWGKVKEIAQCEEVPGEECSVLDLSLMGLYRFEEDLLDLCYAARKEHEVELDLVVVAASVRSVEFSTLRQPEEGGFVKLHRPKSHFVMLADNIGIINRLRHSIHRHPFQALIDYWELTLGLLHEILELLVLTESECRTLHELYRISSGVNGGSGASRNTEMADFNGGFRECFAQWCEMMRYISTARLVEDVCPVGQEFIGELETIRHRINQQAEALCMVLYAQRVASPRFYLLSDAQLVGLIAAPLNYVRLQRSLPVLFENVIRLGIVEAVKSGARTIGGVYTRDGEHLPFASALQEPGPGPGLGSAAETMNQLERCLRETMEDLLSQCHTALRRGYFRRVESGWLHSWPLQLCLKSAELLHTLHTRNALVQCSLLGHKKPLKMLRSLHAKLLNELTHSARYDAAIGTDRWQRKKLNDLMTVELNARDLIDRLCRRSELHGLESFEWVSQLHSSWNPSTRKCIMQLLHAHFQYGYECKRSFEPMLLTPVSERARLAMVCAMKARQVPLLVGTSGANCGRRTILYSLAYSLGVFLLTFDCEASTMAKDVTRIVDGLMMLGGWLLLSSFERMSSAAITQISDCVRESLVKPRKIVTSTIKESSHVFNTRFQLFAHVGSITKSIGKAAPAGASFDRTLFRPVTFSSADRVKILESWLWLAGFDHSMRIARLIQLLMQQVKLIDHGLVEQGLFSLRRIEQIIESCRSLLLQSHEDPPLENETTLRNWDFEKQTFLLAFSRSYEGCVSKRELEVCNHCLGLVFGSFKLESQALDDGLIILVKEQFMLMNLTPSDRQIEKILLLHQTLLSSKRPVLVTGDPGMGKSACIDVALRVLKPFYKPHRLVPNVLHKHDQPRLFDREWLDGIISAILQPTTPDDHAGKKCLIFDSVPCGEWIDCVSHLTSSGSYMNSNFTCLTAPDDPDHDVKVVVECVGPLDTMAPSQVSHFALVYVANGDLCWEHVIEAWLRLKPQNLLRERLKELADKYLDKLLSFRRDVDQRTVAVSDLSVVRTFCQLCDSLLAPFNASKVFRPESGEATLQRWNEALLKVCFFCAVWAIGGLLDDTDSQGKFDLLLREQHPEAGYPLKGNVYKYYVDLPEGVWRSWDTKLPQNPKPVENANGVSIYRSTFIRSPQMVAYEFLVQALMRTGAPVMLGSTTAVGKTALIEAILSQLDSSRYSSMRVVLTQRTMPMQLRARLRCHALKIMKDRLYPENRRKLICFLDDFHTAESNPYAMNEFVRGFCQTSEWFEATTPIRIEQCQTVLALRLHQCHSPASAVMQSLLNKCSLLIMTPLNDEQLGRIFTDMILSASVGLSKLESLLEQLGPATVDFVTRLAKILPPTPARLRYQFSLQTIATIVGSLCHCLRHDHGDLSEKASLLRLWIHECYRESWDRLERADYKKFYERFNETVSTYFEVTLHGLCPNNQSPIFTNVMGTGSQSPYEDARDASQLIARAEALWNEPSDVASQNVIIHREAVEHSMKVLRKVRLGHAGMILMGHPGAGRTVVCQVAARLSRGASIGYHRMNVRTRDAPEAIVQEFSRLFQVCTRQRTLAVLNLDDIVDVEPNERLMELLSGVVSGEELSVLFCEKTPASAGASLVEGTDITSTMDWHKVRANLHLVLCLPLETAAFRIVLQRNPSMARNLTVDCMHDWPEGTLLEISKKYLLKNVPLNVPIQGAVESTGAGGSASKARRRESLVQSTEERLQIATHDLLFRIHYAVQTEATLSRPAKRNIIAPCSWYFELLDTFERVLREKRLTLQGLHRKFRVGIERIENATVKVANLSEELQHRQSEIALFQVQLDEFLEQIAQQTQEADEQTEEVSVKRVKIGAEEVVCKQLAEIAGADLQRAMPALNAAVAALDSLNKKDMNEIKSYSRPPTRVELVMEAVMILLGKEPTWAESKRQLGEQKFLDTLKGFDRNNITERTLKTIGGYVRNPDLEPDKVGTVSKAAKSLMLWVRAIENYGKVYKYVGPKIRKMEDANASLLEKQNELAAAERKLVELAERLALLRAEYDAKIAEKQLLEEAAHQMALKLKRARKLVDNLAGERIRWLATKEDLEGSYGRMIGDTLLAAGFLTYLGPVDIETRSGFLAQWLIDLETLDMPFSQHFSLTSFFYEPGVFIRWHENGLPPDDFSAENATILMNSARVALIVDPQQEAQRWLLAELGTNTQLLDFDDEIIESTVVDTFEQHLPLMVANINRGNVGQLDDLFALRDMMTDTCSRCQEKHQTARPCRERKHTMHLISREQIPIPGPMLKRVNQLSFVLGAEGLEMKMLGLLVQYENPSLEERKELLQQTILRNKAILVELEERILRILNESQVPLLEDEELYSVLESSRATFETVSGGLQQAEQTRQDIQASREVYRSCATRAALLFLVLSDLQLFNPLYRYSLDWYKALFMMSLERSGRVQQVAERRRRIDDYHTFSVFRNVSRGLFENDRKLFGFYLCVRLLFADEALSPREFRFLVYGAGKIDRQEQMENPCRGWLTELQWDQVTDLDRLPGFHGIVESFAELPSEWHQWYLAAVPEKTPLPGNWEMNLKKFQKHLVVRCLRMDRLESCMTDFTKDTLGTKFVTLPVGTLEDAFHESVPQTPILLLLRGTSNPLAGVERLARKVHDPKKDGKKHRFESINMTEGRMESFVQLLQRCILEELWLFVGNCHLSQAFLKQLPQVLVFMNCVNSNSKFRLWLSSQPHEALPVSVLQSCIKIAYEEPKGIRHHMANLYEEIGETQFKKSTAAMKQGASGKTSTETHYKRLLFVIAYMHGLLLERNNFQQLGWIEPCHFVNNDFGLAERLLTYGLGKLLVKKVHDTREQLSKGVAGNMKTPSRDVSLEDDFQGLGLAEDEQQYDVTPWQYIKGAVLEMCYGAQIGSSWDRRIYETYIEQLFQPQLVATMLSGASFSRDRFWLPRDGSYQTYVEFITQLPAHDGVDAFGQHENANIKYLTSRSSYMLQMLIGVAKDPSAQGPPQHRPIGQDYERTKQTISDLLSALPVCLDYENAVRIVGDGANRTPVSEVLLAEIHTYNTMLDRVQSDCHCLLRALRGATNELLDEDSGKWSTLFRALQTNRVPESWPTSAGVRTWRGQRILLPLSDWVLEFRERVQYFRRWTETGQLPFEIVLGRFTDPQRFLSGVLQHHAHVHRLAFEELRWEFTIYATDKPLERIPIHEGFIARGLTLENGSWDWEKQTLAVPAILELTCPMPPVAFRPVRGAKAATGEPGSRSTYQCPVFYSPQRSKDSYILTLPLAVDEEQDGRGWTQYNTALVLNG